MTGQAICRLMRRHTMTIRALASRLGVPQKRVRLVRRQGLNDPAYVRDWVEAITGRDPGASTGGASCPQ